MSSSPSSSASISEITPDVVTQSFITLRRDGLYTWSQRVRSHSSVPALPKCRVEAGLSLPRASLHAQTVTTNREIRIGERSWSMRTPELFELSQSRMRDLTDTLQAVARFDPLSSY